MKIAITGGIGSGKSTVAAFIREMGYTVVSADEAYSRVAQSRAYLDKVKKMFPSAVSGNPPVLDRAKLSAEVFADSAKLEKLNELAHPMIMKEMFAKAKGKEPSFFEVPLLFEGGYENLFDKVIVVMREREARIRSVCMRSGLTREQVEARIGAQTDYERDFSQYIVLQNDGDVELLKENTRRIIKALFDNGRGEC